MQHKEGNAFPIFPSFPWKEKSDSRKKSLVLKTETADPCESASFIKEVEREGRA